MTQWQKVCKAKRGGTVKRCAGCFVLEFNTWNKLVQLYPSFQYILRCWCIFSLSVKLSSLVIEQDCECLARNRNNFPAFDNGRRNCQDIQKGEIWGFRKIWPKYRLCQIMVYLKLAFVSTSNYAPSLHPVNLGFGLVRGKLL